MTSTILRSTAAAIAFAGALALATSSMAAMVNFKASLFKASLSGKSEVPPNATAGTGSVTATYDDASKKLTWKGTYSGLTGPATAAHFHGPAPEGKNADVLVPISPNGPSFEGSATLNDAQAKALMDGDMYVNVHTATNKGGEIRGQLTK